MKKSLLFVLSLVFCLTLNAQISAITNTGEEVILYSDGTWQYINGNINEEATIRVNKIKFVKESSSTFLVKSKIFNIGVWINPKEWSFTQSPSDEASEYLFEKKSSDLYAMLITEQVEIPIETLKGIAYQNAKEVAPDIKIIDEEYRFVNGQKVLSLQMQGTLQGIKFVYYGYYYSNPKGTVQFVTYTGESLFNLYKSDMEIFLNGLTKF